MKKRKCDHRLYRLLTRIVIIVISILFFLAQVNGEVLARFIWSG